jgi:hypothetical protein
MGTAGERGGLTFSVHVNPEAARLTIVSIARVLHMATGLATASSIGCWLGALPAGRRCRSKAIKT